MRTRPGVARTWIVVVETTLTTLRRPWMWVDPTDEKKDEDEGCGEDVEEG